MSVRTRIGLFSLVDQLDAPEGGQSKTATGRLREVVAQGVHAEAVGFERFAVGEHHFSEYILPSPNLLLSAIAVQTEAIRLFTTVTLINLHDPVVLAEEVAVIDALSGGRLELSVARGVSDATSRAFGLDPGRPYGVMRDKLEVLLSVLKTGEVQAAGLDSMPLTPRPLQLPHPPVWIGGGLSTGSSELAAELGLPLILPSLFRYPQDYLPMVDHYRARMDQHGHTSRIRLGMPSYCWVAETSQQARRTFRPHLEHYVERVRHLRNGFGRPMDFEGLLRGPAICGSPAEVVDRIGAINELLGLDTHIVIMDVGGVSWDALQRSMDLMGAHVLPHFAPPG